LNRRLIVNADDFGRTRGVNAGILRAHLEGIVTSGTAMVLEPAAAEGFREASSRGPRLDLGLHVVLTGGGPSASAGGSLPTLAPGGRFVRNAEALPERIEPGEIRLEIAAQVAAFERLAGRPPSHLDSHHHAALHPAIAPEFEGAAARLGVPARASSPAARESLRRNGVRTPDFFEDGFFGAAATREKLRAILEALPGGTSELMCHPAVPDAELLATSTYAAERERELEILCDPGIRELLAKLEIALVGYSAL
jgi:chitin disaccharide deacetylase